LIRNSGTLDEQEVVMKRILIVVVLMAIGIFSFAEQEERLVLMFFASTQCAHSTNEGNISALKIIKQEFKEKYSQYDFKMVMVCFDNPFEESLALANRYGDWHEISLGARYKNELALRDLNESILPAVPHLIIYKDTYRPLERLESITRISTREKLVDLIGFQQINEWKTKGYPLGIPGH
jgi:hypothetical protein